MTKRMMIFVLRLNYDGCYLKMHVGVCIVMVRTKDRPNLSGQTSVEVEVDLDRDFKLETPPPLFLHIILLRVTNIN